VAASCNLQHKTKAKRSSLIHFLRFQAAAACEIQPYSFSSSEEASCHSVVVLEVADHRLDGRSSAILFSLLSPLVVAELFAYFSRNHNLGSTHVFTPTVALLDEHTAEGFSGHLRGLLQRGVQSLSVVKVLLKTHRRDDHATVAKHRYRGLTATCLAALECRDFVPRKILIVRLAFGDAQHIWIIHRDCL
jgi:hypothetical protein